MGFLRHAIGTLVSFHCFLRVGELVGLRREDVADAGDVRMGVVSQNMTLRLRVTKTGRNQWVTVQDTSVRQLLRLLLNSTEPRQLLFPFSTSSFRHHFKTACSSLGLSSSYVPHSLRHGGATRAHLLGMSMEDILLRGRWASSKSARRYVQAGRALLLTMDIPHDIQVVASDISHHIYHLLLISLSQ
jgi:integrase